MNKNIIALQGISHIGKTTTLKCLIAKIEKTYKIDVLYDGVKDLIVVARINNKKLGITTYGDSRRELVEDFNLMGKCDLYVCACHTKGGTVDFLEQETSNGLLLKHGKWYYKEKGYKYNFDKTVSKINNMQANLIYEEIIEILK